MFIARLIQFSALLTVLLLVGCVSSVPESRYSNGSRLPAEEMNELLSKQTIRLGQSTTADVIEALAKPHDNKARDFFGLVFYSRSSHELALYYCEPTRTFGFGLNPHLFFLPMVALGEGTMQGGYMIFQIDPSTLVVRDWRKEKSLASDFEQVACKDYRLYFGDRVADLSSRGYLFYAEQEGANRSQEHLNAVQARSVAIPN